MKYIYVYILDPRSKGIYIYIYNVSNITLSLPTNFEYYFHCGNI